MRYGLTIPYPDEPLAAHADLLREAAAAGYTDFWSAEASGADAFTPLALAAAWVPDAMLGTAIVPAFTRGPAVIAMSAAALAEAAPGRFMLGIGTGRRRIRRPSTSRRCGRGCCAWPAPKATAPSSTGCRPMTCVRSSRTWAARYRSLPVSSRARRR